MGGNARAFFNGPDRKRTYGRGPKVGEQSRFSRRYSVRGGQPQEQTETNVKRTFFFRNTFYIFFS